MMKFAARLALYATLICLFPNYTGAVPWQENTPVKVASGQDTRGEILSGSYFSVDELKELEALEKIPAYKDLPKESAERVTMYRRIVKTIMEKAEQPMAAAGSCEAFTVLWLEALGKLGYPLFYAQTSGMGELVVDGKTSKADKIHVFVADRCGVGESGEVANEIIIDPTFTQFLEPGECLFEDSLKEYLSDGKTWNESDMLARLPVVFVGTHRDAISLFQAYRVRIRNAAKSGIDDKVGHYDAALFAELIYSFGRNSGLRTNLDLGLAGQ
ncbi:MAG: hypothetical protein ACOYXC_01840 [Candidatus Rifleibacteriota bacterium]